MAGHHVDHQDGAADGNGQPHGDGDDQPDQDVSPSGSVFLDGMSQGTVKVTSAARPVCFLKLTGITLAR